MDTKLADNYGEGSSREHAATTLDRVSVPMWWQHAHDLYFESAGTILTLITIGKYLETKSKGKTSEAITKLLNLAPKTVTVVRDGVEQVIDATDVEKGEIFLVKPGESVAVDGIVLEGKSSFDESAITGESIPVPKQEGDTIVSASMNKSGLIRAKATKVGEDTTIAQIIRLTQSISHGHTDVRPSYRRVPSHTRYGKLQKYHRGLPHPHRLRSGCPCLDFCATMS